MRWMALICAGLITASPAAAQDRETLGIGRILNNDFLGDTQDRWRSGSYTYSIVRGTDWSGDLATTSGPILEYRLGFEVISPKALRGAGSTDRAYSGALSAGLHTHFAAAQAEMSVGVDLVAVGPQTGLLDAQNSFHKLIGASRPSAFVVDNQLENAVYPTLLAQVTYPVQLTPDVSFRPFIEAQYGIEDIVRVGGDVLVGAMLGNDLWLRDGTTGQLYSGIDGGQAGTGFVFGADYAVVGDSAYFPASFGTVAKEERLRARAGVQWRLGDGISYFYGVTYLSEEFEGQPEGQFVGSVKLNFNF